MEIVKRAERVNGEKFVGGGGGRGPGNVKQGRLGGGDKIGEKLTRKKTLAEGIGPKHHMSMH